MKCRHCGAELPEGSRFCEKCGERQADEVVWETDSVPSGVTAEVLCPCCGRKVAADDLFCGACGAKLGAVEKKPAAEETAEAGGPAKTEDPAETPEAEEPEKAPKALPPEEETSYTDPDFDEEEESPAPARFRFLVPAVTLAVLALVIAAVARIFTARGPEKRQQTEVLFYREDSLYLTDVKGKTEPREITDSCLDGGISPYEGLVEGDILSEDGRYLFYREDYDGESFNLYRRSMSVNSKGERIASNVTDYEPLPDNLVVYRKGDSLYYYGGGEPIRIGKNVRSYQVDPDGRAIVWMEEEGRSHFWYYRELSGEAEPVELEKDTSLFAANDSLTCFLALKGGVLYLVGQTGDKQRIAQDVTSVESFDLDSEEIYYMTESPVRMAFTDVIVDDDGTMTEDDWRRVSDLGQFEIPYRKLIYHRKQGDAEISDRCRGGVSSLGQGLSQNADFCMYLEGPRIEKLKADWSEFRDSLEDEDFGADLLTRLVCDGEFSGLKLAAGERTLAEYEDLNGIDEAVNAVYDEENRKIYLLTTDPEEGTSKLSEIPLTGGNAGVRAEIAGDGGPISSPIVTAEGIWYIRDAGEYGGDLYLNGQEIAYDVHGVWKVRDGLLAYSYDYDESRDGGVEFSLVLYEGGKKTSVEKEISFAECAPDGTVLMLKEFDPRKGEGSLIYFDGKDCELLEEHVNGFTARDESVPLR